MRLISSTPYNLPQLLDGELLYNWFGRVHLRNGNGLATQTSMQLLGDKHAAFVHDFPALLDTLVATTDGRIGEQRELAERHTLLGYYLPFLPATTARKVFDDASKGSDQNLKHHLGLLASRVGAFHPLKICRMCLAEDLDSLGFFVLRVTHQYPSVLVCVRHECALESSSDEVSPVHRREWLIPKSVADPAWVTNFSATDTQLDRLSKLATLTSFAAKMPAASLDSQILSYCYQSALQGRGLLTARGSLRMRDLVESFREYYVGFEALPGFISLATIDQNWAGFVGSLGRKCPRNGHPLKHLLFIAFLFDSWSDFRQTYDRMSSQLPAWLGPVPPGQDEAADPRLEQFARLINDEKLSVTAAATRIGVSASTGVRWATVLGIAYVSRSKTLKPAFLDDVRGKLRAGETKLEIQVATGISAVSLNRLISSEPAVRQAWLSARHELDRAKNRAQFVSLTEANVGVPVKLVRKIPGNGYQWLYRHDRQWLTEHLPAIWSEPKRPS